MSPLSKNCLCDSDWIVASLLAVGESCLLVRDHTQDGGPGEFWIRRCGAVVRRRAPTQTSNPVKPQTVLGPKPNRKRSGRCEAKICPLGEIPRLTQPLYNRSGPSLCTPLSRPPASCLTPLTDFARTRGASLSWRVGHTPTCLLYVRDGPNPARRHRGRACSCAVSSVASDSRWMRVDESRRPAQKHMPCCRRFNRRRQPNAGTRRRQPNAGSRRRLGRPRGRVEAILFLGVVAALGDGGLGDA